MLPLFRDFVLFAEDAGQVAADPAAAPGQPSDMLTMMFPLAALMLLYFVLIVGPDRKRQKEKQKKIDSLKKNDKVVTVGGIYGVVANVKPGEDEIVLKIDEDKDVKIRVTKASISMVISASEPEPAAKPGA